MRTFGSISNAYVDESDDLDSDYDEEEQDQNVRNALFLRWLKESHDEKDWRKLRGPPRPTGYENAVIAVRMCKVKYEHPADLYVLKGVGPTCVERLTEKLEEHCKMNGIKMPLHPSQRQTSANPSKRVKAARKEAASTKSQSRVRKSSVQLQDQDSNKSKHDSDGDNDGSRHLRRRLSDLEPKDSKSKSEALAELRASRAARKNRS
ncbi:hypothetical protein CPB85DRAFT_699922 [Mucidula mucida]|nr:hypothetical protein CPB85DRAFT_699922 [Mucidula mucida]